MNRLRTGPARRWAAAAVVVSTALLAGCASGPYPVEGTVVWADDGTPAKELENSQVVFEQPETNTTARGVIQGDATFRMTTLNPDDGAMPGEHKVLIAESQKSANKDGTQLMPPILDQKYRSTATTDLTVTVAPGKNAATLKLHRIKK